ncbi:very short patch repair endonuclease [Paraburkholderia sp. WC7.3g]|uniref:very short patch repair endonuclease n=1 Tax=Paraburkholderia sp. WC7.3g TaxID=2991070 RepID=UPI003D24D482
MDIVDKETRSRMMCGIRSAHTRPELQVRSLLHGCGFRFRLHDQKLPGKPDIVLRRHKAVALVHGCFWHGHARHLFRLPSSRPEFWRSKIARNTANDAHVTMELLDNHWRVCVIWECALKGRMRLSPEVLSQRVRTWLLSNERFCNIVEDAPS